MLKETAPPVASAEVLDELARHLRLGSDIATEQTAELTDVFGAAVAHIEATLGLCVSPRSFVWRARLNSDGRVTAAMAPVIALSSATDVLNGELLDLSEFELDRGERRMIINAPRLRNREIDLSFEAGFGADWSETPADLRRAVKMLAAHYYDQRHTAGGDARETLYGVTTLLQPWRPMRITLGAGA